MGAIYNFVPCKKRPFYILYLYQADFINKKFYVTVFVPQIVSNVLRRKLVVNQSTKRGAWYPFSGIQQAVSVRALFTFFT